MSPINIALLRIVLADIEASLPAIEAATDLPTIIPRCRLVHARSLLAGLIDIETKHDARAAF